MVSIPKVIGLMSCGFLLCLGLSNAALATDDMKADQPDRQGGQAGLKGEQDKLKGGHMITGEVLRVEGGNGLADHLGEEMVITSSPFSIASAFGTHSFVRQRRS